MELLKNNWLQAPVHRRPFPWLSTSPGELFPEESARLLAATFPADGFTRFDRSARATGKQYCNNSRPLRGLADLGTLAPVWRALVRDILAPAYRNGVARLFDQEPALAIELRLVRHGPSDWLGPHTDRAEKLFSHILYFNDSWPAKCGGCLEILQRDDPGSAVASIVPELGASALLCRTEDSWHQVTRVAPGTGLQRRSLLIHGLRS